jgi:hypothetical protein
MKNLFFIYFTCLCIPLIADTEILAYKAITKSIAVMQEKGFKIEAQLFRIKDKDGFHDKVTFYKIAHTGGTLFLPLSFNADSPERNEMK